MSKINLDTDKIKNYILTGLIVLVLLLGTFSAYTFNELQNEQIKLTARDAEIQQLDASIGLSRSRLLEVEELNKKFERDIAEFPERLQKLIKEHNLQLKSKDVAIAFLQSKVRGGHTKVVIKDSHGSNENTNSQSPIIEDIDGNPIEPPNQVISYEWEEKLGRFKLKDPDIFVSNNEEFQSNQHMKVIGHVFFGKDGQLQIRKVELQEVVPNGTDENGNPKFELVPNSTIALIDSQFEYTNNLPVKKKRLLDIITLRPIATFDTAVTPGLGIEFANLGRLIDYVNLGLNAKVSADLSDPLGGSLQQSRMSIGAHYQFIPPFVDTNFAVGASVGVPFSDLTQPVFTVDLVLFLTQDLSPFN